MGVVGRPDHAAAHLGAWALHLAALQRPADLSLALLAGPGSEALAPLAPGWRWLPHAAPVPREPGTAGGRWAVHLVEVGGRSPAEVAELDAALAGADRSVIWVGRSVEELPPGCAATVALDPSGSAATLADPTSGDVAIEPDGLAPHVFDDLARLLAPLEAAPAVPGAGSRVVDGGGSSTAPADGLPTARAGRRPGTP